MISSIWNAKLLRDKLHEKVVLFLHVFPVLCHYADATRQKREARVTYASRDVMMCETLELHDLENVTSRLSTFKVDSHVRDDVMWHDVLLGCHTRYLASFHDVVPHRRAAKIHVEISITAANTHQAIPATTKDPISQPSTSLTHRTSSARLFSLVKKLKNAQAAAESSGWVVASWVARNFLTSIRFLLP